MAILPGENGIRRGGDAMGTQIGSLVAWVLLALGQGQPETTVNKWEVPFEIQDGYMIVAVGSLPGGHAVHLMIDTGADCSVIDRKSARRLGLTVISGEAHFNAFGRVNAAERAILRALRLGPVMTTLPCLVADIPFKNVDVIIGLDLLRRSNLTIDFSARKIEFGRTPACGAWSQLEPGNSLMILPVRIGGDDFRLLVDTGADRLYLFGLRLKGWMRISSIRANLVSTNLAGRTGLKQIALPSLQIGTYSWRNLEGLIVPGPEPVACDGALGVAVLNLKRLHLDFARGLLGWER
jgi:predicted aspartyl protease